MDFICSHIDLTMHVHRWAVNIILLLNIVGIQQCTSGSMYKTTGLLFNGIYLLVLTRIDACA